MDTGRNEIVSCTLGSGLAQDRCLDLKEALLCHELAHQHEHAASKHQIALDIGSSQIQITVFQSRLLVCLAVLLDLERRCLGLGQNAKILRDDLNISGL